MKGMRNVFTSSHNHNKRSWNMLVLIQISPGDIKVAIAEETPMTSETVRGTWRQGLTNEASGRREWCGDAPSCNKNTQL